MRLIQLLTDIAYWGKEELCVVNKLDTIYKSNGKCKVLFTKKNGEV